MINQLIANIKKTGAPVVAGLDPMMRFIPEHIQKKAFAEYGESLEGRQLQSGGSTKKSWIIYGILSLRLNPRLPCMSSSVSPD